MTNERASNEHGDFFKVPTKYKGQKPEYELRVESELITCESSEDGSESPQFFHYGQKLHHIMERMGYVINKRSGLNFSK